MRGRGEVYQVGDLQMIRRKEAVLIGVEYDETRDRYTLTARLHDGTVETWEVQR